MGVFGLPQYRIWSDGTIVKQIADTMTINRFDKIKQFLNFNDNVMTPGRGTKLYKVRPLIHHFQ